MFYMLAYYCVVYHVMRPNMLVPWTLLLSHYLSFSVSRQDSQQLSQLTGGKRIMAIKSEIKVLFIWSEGAKRMNEKTGAKST